MTNEMTTDNMSNEEVIEVLKGIVFGGFDRTTIKERQALDFAIKALEERPQGEWEYTQYDGNPNIGNWHCSECRHIVFGGYSQKPYYYFCPMCGADMRGDK